MKVTLNQIAEAAGVSRGTVDRALNNRGRINPEVAERIVSLAKEMGYHRNNAGRALALSRNEYKIGVVIQATDTPFMKDVLEGIYEARDQVREFGFEVVIKKIKNINSQLAMTAMDELRENNCLGIALMPSDDSALIEKVNQFVSDGIPVITFNSDIETSNRQCFVGQNTCQSGKTAAGLMAEILPESSECLIISGYADFRSHNERSEGFYHELSLIRPDIQFLPIQCAEDDDNLAKAIAAKALESLTPSKSLGIYLAAAGLNGVCQAVCDSSLTNRVKIISNDLTEANCERLRQNEVTFLIGQDAHTQGYEPIMMLFYQLFENRQPRTEPLYTDITIMTKYNI